MIATDPSTSENRADPLVQARRAIASGDALAAVDLLQGLRADDHTVASRQLLAMALIRSGALGDAWAQINWLLDLGHEDEETLGLVARAAKARWQAGVPGALQAAREAYQQAYAKTGGTWTGVNAATLARIAGDVEGATRIATTLSDALAKAPPATSAKFWHRATQGEVALLLGRLEEAVAHYTAARALAPHAFGDLHSARLNADALLAAMDLPADALASAFPVVTVAVFSGHTVDRPGRAVPRFPATDEASVLAAIEHALKQHEIEIGISAAACGGDILFLEALQRAGKDTHIILPHSAEDFRRISVTDIGGETWGLRFDEVMRRAKEVTLLAQHPGEDLSYQFQGAVMAGAATLRARAVGGRVLGLTYWDGEPGGVGGTSTVVEEWAQRGLEVELLPVRTRQGVRPGGRLDAQLAREHLAEVNLRRAGGQRVVSILFADAVGFSKLGELQVKAFVQEFWGRVGRLLENATAGGVLYANTWGDGLFLVFADSALAANVALDLAAMVTTTNWPALGLAEHTNIRVALHAGPAYEIDDPVTQRPGFAGMHISRAARIEPVTPPGQVYVSESFAALLAFDDNHNYFACEYVGTVPLAKEYGRFRTYRLTRR